MFHSNKIFVMLKSGFCAGASEDSFTSASTTPKAGSKASTSEVRASSRNPSTIGRGAATVSSKKFFSFLYDCQ